MNTQVGTVDRWRGERRRKPAAPRTSVCRRALQRGFTLVELMTTLTVMVILLAVAVPGLSAFVGSSRVNGLQSELVASLVLARSEATRRGVPVGVIASAAPVDGKAEFSGGWKVWVDSNADAVQDAAETIIREYPATSGGASVGSGGVSQLRFGPNGFLTPASAVTFTVCGAAGTAHGYQVRLEPMGLVDVKEGPPCS